MSNPLKHIVKHAKRNVKKTGKAIGHGINEAGAAVQHQTEKAGKAIQKSVYHTGSAIQKGVKRGSKALVKAGTDMNMANRIKDRNKRRQCRAIIHGSSAAAAASDKQVAEALNRGEEAVMHVQTEMIITLGSVFGIKVDSEEAVNMVKKDLLAQGFKIIKYATTAFSENEEDTFAIGPIVGKATTALGTESIGWNAAVKFQKRAEKKRH